MTRRFSIPALLLALLPARAFAQIAGTLNVTDNGGGGYSLSWAALPAPAADATCTASGSRIVYSIAERRVMHNKSMTADHDGNGGFNNCGGALGPLCPFTGITATAQTILNGDGSLCFDVGGNAVTLENCLVGGVGPGTFAAQTAASVSYTGSTCHTFVHPTLHPVTNQFVALPFVSRVDANGGQLGFGQQWSFSYFVDNDSTATMKVFGPGVAFPAPIFIAGVTDQNFVDQPAIAADAEARGVTCTYQAPPAVDTGNGTNNPHTGPDCPIRTLISAVARPGENFTATANSEVWDLRDANGAVVPNGTYSLWGSFTDVRDNSNISTPNDQPGGHFTCPSQQCPSTTLAFRGYLTDIPVDVLRLMNLKTVGITQAGQKASITYDLTGNAQVREAIAQPGTRFMIDAAGNCGTPGFIQAQGVFCKVLKPDGVNTDAACEGNAAMTPLPGPVCEDPNHPFHGRNAFLVNNDGNALYITTLTFNHNSGTGITDTWDGSVYERTQVSTPGVYNFAISAIDGYGNRAVDQSGNDTPILATIVYDVTPPPPPVDTTAPKITDITINCSGGSLDLGGGPPFQNKTCVFPQTFTGLTITVSHELAGETLGVFTVSVGGPGGAVLGATSSPDGATSIKFTPTVPAATAGNYTVTYNLCDKSNNCITQPASLAANFAIGAAGAVVVGPPVQQSAAQFKGSVALGPNPVRAAPAKLNFNMSLGGTVDIDIYQLTGERLFHQSLIEPAGADQFAWQLVNDQGARVTSGVYLVRITAHDGNSVFRTTRKVVILNK